MAMHQSGRFPIERLCKTYPVAKLEEAIHDMHTGEVSIFQTPSFKKLLIFARLLSLFSHGEASTQDSQISTSYHQISRSPKSFICFFLSSIVKSFNTGIDFCLSFTL